MGSTPGMGSRSSVFAHGRIEATAGVQDTAGCACGAVRKTDVRNTSQPVGRSNRSQTRPMYEDCLQNGQGWLTGGECRYGSPMERLGIVSFCRLLDSLLHRGPSEKWLVDQELLSCSDLTFTWKWNMALGVMYK